MYYKEYTRVLQTTYTPNMYTSRQVYHNSYYETYLYMTLVPKFKAMLSRTTSDTHVRLMTSLLFLPIGLPLACISTKRVTFILSKLILGSEIDSSFLFNHDVALTRGNSTAVCVYVHIT